MSDRADRIDRADRVTVTRLTVPKAYREQLAEDVREGLGGDPKRLPSKYFYDARGSELFEQITSLPEYYLTRAETEILERHADTIMEAVHPIELLEIGSGSSSKTRLLLEAMHRVESGVRYIPLDVSEAALREAAEALSADYPWLKVDAMRGDLATDLVYVERQGRRLVVFLGSTIGNLYEDQRVELYTKMRGMLGPGDRLLVGYDLVKDRETLERAYNDSAGVTAEFNRNILRVVNRELGATFPVDQFRHVSTYDEETGRIQSGLLATRAMEVEVPGASIVVSLSEGEEIRTEISKKFRREGVVRELQRAGLVLEAWFTDSKERFALALAAEQD